MSGRELKHTRGRAEAPPERGQQFKHARPHLAHVGDRLKVVVHTRVDGGGAPPVRRAACVDAAEEVARELGLLELCEARRRGGHELSTGEATPRPRPALPAANPTAANPTATRHTDDLACEERLGAVRGLARVVGNRRVGRANLGAVLRQPRIAAVCRRVGEVVEPLGDHEGAPLGLCFRVGRALGLEDRKGAGPVARNRLVRRERAVAAAAAAAAGSASVGCDCCPAAAATPAACDGHGRLALRRALAESKLDQPLLSRLVPARLLVAQQAAPARAQPLVVGVAQVELAERVAHLGRAVAAPEEDGAELLRDNGRLRDFASDQRRARGVAAR